MREACVRHNDPALLSSVNNMRVLLATIEDALKNRLRTASENAGNDEV